MIVIWSMQQRLMNTDLDDGAGRYLPEYKQLSGG